MIDSTTELIARPPLVFKKEISLHFSKCGRKMYERLKSSVNLMQHPGETKLENLRKAIENICESISN